MQTKDLKAASKSNNSTLTARKSTKRTPKSIQSSNLQKENDRLSREIKRLSDLLDLSHFSSKQETHIKNEAFLFLVEEGL